MTLIGLLNGLKRRWLTVLAFGVVGILAALAYSAIAIPLYKAEARVFVTVATTATTTTAEKVAGNQYAIQSTASYVEVATSDRVLQGVIDDLGLLDSDGVPVTTEELAKDVEVVTAPESAVITISATDPSPEQAALIANTLVTKFGDEVNAIESPVDGGVAIIDLDNLREAIPPLEPITGGVLVVLALGLVAGIVVGIGVAIALTALDKRVRTGADVRSAINRPLLGVVPSRNQSSEEVFRTEDPPARYSSLAFEVDGMARETGTSSFLVVPANVETPHAVAGILLGKALAGLGSSVVIVDATAGAKAFGTIGKGEPGLREVLTGTISLDAALISPTDRRVDVLPGGSTEGADVVSATQLKALVGELENVYDFVLVISGEMGGSTGIFAFRKVVDGAIIVVREGKLDSPKLGAGAHWVESAGTPVLGAVMLSKHTSETPASVA